MFIFIEFEDSWNHYSRDVVWLERFMRIMNHLDLEDDELQIWKKVN
jgi:hypothetical protein